MEYEKRRPPQADLPYEVQMKYIIHGYRKLQEQLDYIVPYTKKLEKTIENQKEKIAKQGSTNMRLHEKFIEANREKKRWKAYSEWLSERIEKMARTMRCNGLLAPSDIE